MPPNSESAANSETLQTLYTDDKRQVSFPNLQYPVTRNVEPRSPQQWLKGKKVLDGAEQLWRIRDSLYDLTEFVKLHPGGQDWINLSMGTDITEAFEVHHLNGLAEEMLPHYFVRKTDAPRNSPFTFHEDGFYKTLKAKVVEKMKEIPNVRKQSDYITDGLLITFIVVSSLSCLMMKKNILYGLALIPVSGYILSSLATAAHNYFHRKDSWRMYLFDLLGSSYADWRIMHVLSHHLHTNTAQDLELSAFEPFLKYLPYTDKSKLGAVYWPAISSLACLTQLSKEVAFSIVNHGGKRLDWTNAIPFLVPAWMWVFGGLPLFWTIAVWVGTMLFASLIFVTIGFTAGHHTDDNFFEGDKPRADYIDWGLHQLDTVVERNDYIGNHFMALTQFGDHYLHHLFPTLDHAELKYLYPILYEHCKEYGVELRTTSSYKALRGIVKQLMRSEPNDFKAKKAN